MTTAVMIGLDGLLIGKHQNYDGNVARYARDAFMTVSIN
jgi:hypothetical protein